MADDEHDPLCPFNRVQQQGCKCPWIIRARDDERRQVILDGEAGIIYRDLEADIRLDERRRIAQAIGAKAATYFERDYAAVMEDAARIARNGGRDE